MKRGPIASWPRTNERADVLVVTSSWPLREKPAYGVFIKRQLDSLEAAGVHCDVFLIHGYRSRVAYPVAALRLAALAASRRRRYRVVHAHGGEAATVAWFYRAAPLIVSYCGDDLLGTPDEHGTISFGARVKARLLRQHARLAAATITKTEEMERVLPRSARAANTVIPNGVDPAEFRPMSQAAARRELGWDGDERVVLFAADANVLRKRFWLAEAACHEAQARVPNLRLRQASGVPASQMPLLMNAADCLLLTSVHEGSPNVVKEALMCNLPVVATRVGDVALLLEGVEPSAIAEPTPLALADALVECLEPARRSNGRERSGWFESSRIAERILAKYREVDGRTGALLRRR
jgi:teichuronic acid biosynthesis glycosyltransferase TuaC